MEPSAESNPELKLLLLGLFAIIAIVLAWAIGTGGDEGGMDSVGAAGATAAGPSVSVTQEMRELYPEVLGAMSDLEVDNYGAGACDEVPMYGWEGAVADTDVFWGFDSHPYAAQFLTDYIARYCPDIYNSVQQGLYG